MKPWYLYILTAIPPWVFRVETMRVGKFAANALYVFNHQLYIDNNSAQPL